MTNYHRRVPQTLSIVVLLLASVSNLGVQLVNASPTPFTEARLKEIDEMRARGVSETELIALNPIIDTQKPLIAPLPPASSSSSSSPSSSSAWFSRDSTSQLGNRDDTTNKQWYQELYTQFRHLLIADATPRRLTGAGSRKPASSSAEIGDDTIPLSATSTHLQIDNPDADAVKDSENSEVDVDNHIITPPHHYPANANEEANIGASNEDEQAEGEDSWRQQRLTSISKVRQRLVVGQEEERQDEEIQRERMEALSSSSSHFSPSFRQVDMAVKAELKREEEEQEEAEGMIVTGRMGSGNLKVRRLL